MSEIYDLAILGAGPAGILSLIHILRMPELVRQIKEIPGIKKVTLTTNGTLLKEQMKELAEAGLDAVNISLDTLNRDCFQKITRRDLLNEALEGIQEALRYPGTVSYTHLGRRERHRLWSDCCGHNNKSSSGAGNCVRPEVASAI